MSARTIAIEAMSLSLSERVELAQTLWASIEGSLPDADEASALIEAARRDEELDSGKVSGICHSDVMQAARRTIGCK